MLAALLAERGVHGFDRPFEGHAGLFALYAGGRDEPEAVLDGLGRRYEGANLSYKPWPSCRGTHAAIAAALQLRAAGLDATAITEVRVVGSSLDRMLCEPREQRTAPRTAIDAKFSLPFTVARARALVHGSVGLDAFSAAARADPAVLSLARRVTYEVDERGAGRGERDEGRVDDDDGPGAATWCRLEVEAAGGTHRVVDGAPGGPDRPLSDETLRRKFLDNAGHAAEPLSGAVRERIADAVAALATADDVGRHLLGLVRHSPP